MYLFVGTDFNFVAFRREGGGRGLGERHEVNALHVAINVFKLGVAEQRVEVAAGSEEQVFAVVAEGGQVGGVPAVGDLEAFFFVE